MWALLVTNLSFLGNDMDAKEFVEICKESQEIAEMCLGWYLVQFMKLDGSYA